MMWEQEDHFTCMLKLLLHKPTEIILDTILAVVYIRS
jgi:hypothetical protein